MSTPTHFESIYKRLTGPVMFMSSLVLLSFIFLITSSDILNSLANISVLQYIQDKGFLLMAEFFVCCLAITLCWCIVKVHRQRSDKIFEKLLALAKEVDSTNSQNYQNDLILKKSVKLMEHTIEDYAILLLMINKNSPKSLLDKPREYHQEGILNLDEK